MKTNNPSGIFQDVHDIRVVDKKKPTVTENSLIIKVNNTGICGTDLHYYHSRLVPSGTVLGHEFSGEISEIGKNITDFKLGERVVVNPSINGIGLGVNSGGFAHYVKMDNPQKDVDIFSIPDTVSNKEGAMVEPFSVGLAAINITDLNIDDNILVTGVGTIGLVTIAGLKAKGYHNILASDVNDFNLAIAKKMGAKYTHNPKTDGSLTQFIENLWGTVPALDFVSKTPNLQAAFECSGIGAVLAESFRCLAVNGNITPIAIYGKPVAINPDDIVLKRVKAKGSIYYTADDYKEAIQLIAENKVDLLPLITHEYPLSKLTDAFKTAANGKDRIKIMIHPN